MQEELTDEEKAEREENALELALETEAEVNAYELARPKPRGIFMPYIHIGDVAHRWVNGNTFGIIINLCVLGITGKKPSITVTTRVSSNSERVPVHPPVPVQWGGPSPRTTTCGETSPSWSLTQRSAPSSCWRSA